MTFCAQFIHFRVFLTKLHRSLLDTKDLNSIVVQTHREHCRQNLRSQARANQHSDSQLIQIGNLHMPRGLAEDFIISDGLSKIYKSDPALNRTHRPDQAHSETWKGHVQDIFCRCSDCTKRLVPINGTSLDKRKRRVGKAHYLTHIATTKAITSDFRFRAIKLFKQLSPMRISIFYLKFTRREKNSKKLIFELE